MHVRKVLVVDDEPVCRTILTRALQRFGWVAMQASSGERALALLEDNRDFDLLVVDSCLPGMQGDQLVELVREDLRLPELPIIMVSGMTSVAELSPLIEQKIDRFLQKPVRLNEFLQVSDEVASIVSR